jgi:hypothetical protein
MSFGERLGASLFHLKNRLFPYTVRVGDLTVPSSDLPYSRKEEQLMHQEAERKLDERTRKLKSKLSD